MPLPLRVIVAIVDVNRGKNQGDRLSWHFRRRTNVQQVTCNIDLSCYFSYLFFSFVLIELKPSALKGKVLREKTEKCEKV